MKRLAGGMIAAALLAALYGGFGGDAVQGALEVAMDKASEGRDYIFGAPDPTADSEVKTVRLIPVLPEAHVTRYVNPEIPELEGVAGLFFDGLDATGTVPAVTNFLGRLERFGQGLSCAYKNDQLAVGAYIDNEYWYSVGLVAVAREPDGWADGANDLLDLGWCWVRNSFFALELRPALQGCIEHLTPEFDGETYHMVVIGSTDWMCAELLGNPSNRSSIPDAIKVAPPSGLTLEPQMPIPFGQPSLEVIGE